MRLDVFLRGMSAPGRQGPQGSILASTWTFRVIRPLSQNPIASAAAPGHLSRGFFTSNSKQKNVFLMISSLNDKVIRFSIIQVEFFLKFCI